MEIRQVKEEEKDSFKAYLNLLMKAYGSTNKLALVKYAGNKYLVAECENGVGIVLNDGEKLTPFCINLDEPLIEILTTRDYNYTMIHSGINEVIKRDHSEKEEIRVSYLPKIDNFQNEVVEISQYNADINALLEYAYDVTGRGGVESSLLFTNYHYPDTIKFSYLNKIGPFTYERKKYYNLGIDEDDVYYSPRIVIRDYPFGTKRKSFDAGKLTSQFENYGFTNGISPTMQSLVADTNEVYKSLKLVNKEYKNFIKGQ